MMMCKAEVTGSITPTVEKHTQSVEPTVTQQDVCCYWPQSRTISYSLESDKSQCHYRQGWCRYEEDKAVKWQLDHSHISLPLAVSALSVRGVFHWTCHPHPHTPHCRRKTEEFFFSVEKAPPSELSCHTAVLTVLTRQSLSGLSWGGDLWHGLPIQSLNNKWSDYIQAASHNT